MYNFLTQNVQFSDPTIGVGVGQGVNLRIPIFG